MGIVDKITKPKRTVARIKVEIHEEARVATIRGNAAGLRHLQASIGEALRRGSASAGIEGRHGGDIVVRCESD